MLEAIRGSRSIFLLYKNEQVVNLRDILVTLHGRYSGLARKYTTSDPALRSSIRKDSRGGELSSWPEDVVICWSVLINEPGKKRARELWTRWTRVRTGYLMSSAPRIKEINGLG
jgi:hypothetical protein